MDKKRLHKKWFHAMSKYQNLMKKRNSYKENKRFVKNDVRFVGEDNDGWLLTDKKDHPLTKTFVNNSMAIMYLGYIAKELAQMAFGNSDNEVKTIELIEL